MAEMFELGGESVLSCDANGPAIDSAQSALDLVGEALGHRASVIALPVSRLGSAFSTSAPASPASSPRRPSTTG